MDVNLIFVQATSHAGCQTLPSGVQELGCKAQAQAQAFSCTVLFRPHPSRKALAQQSLAQRLCSHAICSCVMAIPVMEGHGSAELGGRGYCYDARYDDPDAIDDYKIEPEVQRLWP